MTMTMTTTVTTTVTTTATMDAPTCVNSTNRLRNHRLVQPANAKEDNTGNHLVPNKEAVAALSATLAFRRFDPPPSSARTYGDQAKNGGDDGAGGDRDSSRSSDGLRRLSSILEGRARGMRRASLDTILSSNASISYVHGLDVSLPDSLRGSLQSAGGGGFEMPSLNAQLDEISLDSDELENDDDDVELGGSMSISLLEDKKIGCNQLVPDDSNCDASDNCGVGGNDVNTSCNTPRHTESNKFLQAAEEGFLENGPDSNSSKGGSSARGLVSSLQTLFGSKNARSSSNGSFCKSQYCSSHSNSLKRAFGLSGDYSKNVSRLKNNSHNSGSGKRSSSQRVSPNASWKEVSSLSGCLKHPHSRDDFPKLMKYDPVAKAYRRRRSRVSWTIGDGDDDEDGALLNSSSRAPGACRTSSGFISNSNSNRNNNRIRNNSKYGRPTIESLLSEDGGGSIDLDSLLATATSAATSTDEELLASVILASSAASLWSRMSSQTHDHGHSKVENAGIASGKRDGERKEEGMQLSPDDMISADSIVENTSLEVGKQSGATAGRLEEDIGSRLMRSKTPTVATVTRLAYQEVEDYRLRLQRKRASMMEEGMVAGVDASNDTEDFPSQEEIQDLNGLLQENATNITNALLLQRALYMLGGVPSSAGVSAIVANQDTPTNNRGTAVRKSRSEHTGIDQMALNHFLTLSSSANRGAFGNNNDGAANSQSNADWNAISHAATPSDGDGASIQRGTFFNNPSAGILGRRNTFREGASESSGRRRESGVPQVGAYHSNEPAPLLFRRTFASSVPNRREARAEARRHTLATLARERRSTGGGGGRFVSNDFSSSDSSGISSNSSSSTEGSRGLHSDDSLNYNRNGDRDIYNDEQRRQLSNTGEGAAQDCSPTASTTTAPPSSLNTTSLRCHDGLSAENHGGDDYASPTNDTAYSNPRPTSQQNLRDLLRASVRRESLNSKAMLQAILVSDEIIEADRIETIQPGHHDHRSSSLCVRCSMHDGFAGDNEEEDVENLVPLLRGRLAMMEELMEEQDEEKRDIVWRYRRREKILVVLVVLSAMIIIALIIVAATAFR